MAATQRAWNKNWPLFRCSDAYAFLRGHKTFNWACWWLIWKQNSNYRTFCRIISEHIKFSKDISLDWCPIADFADADSISTTGWHSAQYVAFSCVFGLFWVSGRFCQHYWQNKCKNILTGLCCLVPSYLVPLFGVCLQSGAGSWLCQPFLSSCVCYGMSTKKLPKIL